MKVRFKPPCSGERIIETFKEAVSASDTRWEIKEFFPYDGEEQEWRVIGDQLLQRNKELHIIPLKKRRNLWIGNKEVWIEAPYALVVGCICLDEVYDKLPLQIESVRYADGAHYYKVIKLAECGEFEERFRNLIVAAVKQLQGD